MVTLLQSTEAIKVTHIFKKDIIFL